MFSYVFRSKKCTENPIFFSNFHAMYVEKTLLPFLLLFSLKMLLFSIMTLHLWVALKSHLLILLTAKSLLSMFPDSSSKKILDFLNRSLILIAPSVSNNCIKTKTAWFFFFFHFSMWCLTGFMEVFTAFIKQAPQRTGKKIKLIFSFNLGLGREGLSFERKTFQLV